MFSVEKFSVISSFDNLVAFIFIAGAISKATTVLHAMHKCFMNIVNSRCIDKVELQPTTEELCFHITRF